MSRTASNASNSADFLLQLILYLPPVGGFPPSLILSSLCKFFSSSLFPDLETFFSLEVSHYVSSNPGFVVEKTHCSLHTNGGCSILHTEVCCTVSETVSVLPMNFLRICTVTQTVHHHTLISLVESSFHCAIGSFLPVYEKSQCCCCCCPVAKS